jgi:hypothetical protein
MEEQVIDEMEVGDAISILRVRLEVLETKAADLCKQHFDFAMAENKARAWEYKSVLYAQARMRDNTLGVAWYEVHWYGSKAAKTRRMTKKLIRKSKGKHGYNLDALLKLAQPWEVDMVRDTEQELCSIRREATFIGKAIDQLNHIIKSESSLR